MNIEKIKNYNQTMLAVLVTAAVGFAVIGLFAFIIFLFTEVFNFFPRSGSYSDSNLPVEQYITDNIEQDPTKLYIAYEFPELIDTLHQLYIIPVTQRTADQLVQDYSRKLSFSKTESYGGYDGSSYDYDAKTYINLIVYDAKDGKTETLFKQKILIGSYFPKYFKDETLLLFEAAYKDTNNDRIISLNDQSSLFIYSMNKKLLKQLQFGEKSLLQFSFIGETKDLILRFGIDPAKRSGNISGIDSTILCKYNFELDQLIKINDEKLHKELEQCANKNK